MARIGSHREGKSWRERNARGAMGFRFNGVRVWLTPKRRAEVESLLKQAIQLPELQATLAKLKPEYSEV